MKGYRALWNTRKYRSTRTSTLDGCSSDASYGSITMRPSPMRRSMVRSERTIGGFFHQGVGERPEAFQERLLLLGRERLERPPERAVAAFQPFVHPVRCERVQVDDRPTPVVHVLAPVD